jgi:hypothetical protein
LSTTDDRDAAQERPEPAAVTENGVFGEAGYKRGQEWLAAHLQKLVDALVERRLAAPPKPETKDEPIPFIPIERARPSLVERLRALAGDKALDIGTAWNALDEAADRLEQLEAALARAQRSEAEWRELYHHARDRRALGAAVTDPLPLDFIRSARAAIARGDKVRLYDAQADAALAAAEALARLEAWLAGRPSHSAEVWWNPYAEPPIAVADLGFGFNLAGPTLLAALVAALDQAEKTT